MSKLTKEQALAKIEELKKYVDQVDVETDKPIGIAIKSRHDESIIYQSTKPTLKEAVVEAVENDAYLGDADLRGAYLRDADLSGADLRDAYLRGADLRDADLSGADLSGAYLRGAYLRGADLHNAKFYGQGGNRELKRSQLVDFLHALGFNIVED